MDIFYVLGKYVFAAVDFESICEWLEKYDEYILEEDAVLVNYNTKVGFDDNEEDSVCMADYIDKNNKEKCQLLLIRHDDEDSFFEAFEFGVR